MLVKTSSLLAFASCALLGAAAPALADQTNVFGSVRLSIEHTGATFGASVEYHSIAPGSGELNILIRNLTPIDVGGYLTGIVFNIESSDPNASATLTSTTDADFLNTGPQNAPPFGMFDAGAALEGDWLNGGPAIDGIPVGGMAMFTFAVAASDAESLAVINFVHDGELPSIVVRFRGLIIGDSDKVPIRGDTCDWNDDGLLNSQDYFDFVDDFFANAADYNFDGVTNSQDYFDFLVCFFAS